MMDPDPNVGHQDPPWSSHSPTRPDEHPPIGPFPGSPPTSTPKVPIVPDEIVLAALAERLAMGGVVTLEPYETRVVVAALQRLAEAEAEIETAQLTLRACAADSAAQDAILGRTLGALHGTLATPSPARAFDTEPSIRARSRMLAAARRDASGAGMLGAALRFAASFL